ncbi:hypothetical protein ON010_g15748 [Phytophthora cinnamomi]|nr:hypothetical protein ON010_g15748 [Phytophthora cinnamomi]
MTSTRERKSASQGATQQGWVALTESNWTAVVATVGDTTRRRATRNRIQQAAEDIDEFLAERPDVQVGVIARTHWEMTQARQPAGTTVAVPESATFRQMQHAVEAANPPADRDEAVFQTIPDRINESTELQLTFNVQGLRAILGLPIHNAAESSQPLLPRSAWGLRRRAASVLVPALHLRQEVLVLARDSLTSPALQHFPGEPQIELE